MEEFQFKQLISINPKKFSINTESCIKSAEVMFEKNYYISEDNNGVTTLYNINVKGVNNLIYLYIKKFQSETISTKNKKLVHIFNIENITNAQKYIQISNDFKTISFPDGDSVFIFGIHDLIKNNVLVTCSENTINVIDNEKIHKCLLYETKYVTISIENNKYFICVYDLMKKSQPLFFDTNLLSTIKFSQTCKHLLIVNSNNEFQLINLQKVSDVSIFIVKNNQIINRSITVSDDGSLITFLTNGNILMLINKNNNNNDIKINKIRMDIIDNLDHFNTIIIDHKQLLNIQNHNTIKHIYSLILWKNDKIFISNILNFDYDFYVPPVSYECNLQNDETNVSMCTNGIKYFCENNDSKIYFYDIDIVIPFLIINNLLHVIKSNIEETEENNKLGKKKIIVKTHDCDEEYLVDIWFANLFDNEIKINNDFCSVSILKDKKFSYNSLQIILTFFQDFTKIKKYTQMIYSQFASNCLHFSDIFKICDIMLEVKKNLSNKNTSVDLDVITSYFEYVLIYFVVLFYFLKSTNDKHYLSSEDKMGFERLLKNLHLTKSFLIKSLKMIFGVEIKN